MADSAMPLLPGVPTASRCASTQACSGIREAPSLPTNGPRCSVAKAEATRCVKWRLLGNSELEDAGTARAQRGSRHGPSLRLVSRGAHSASAASDRQAAGRIVHNFPCQPPHGEAGVQTCVRGMRSRARARCRRWLNDAAQASTLLSGSEAASGGPPRPRAVVPSGGLGHFADRGRRPLASLKPAAASSGQRQTAWRPRTVPWLAAPATRPFAADISTGISPCSALPCSGPAREQCTASPAHVAEILAAALTSGGAAGDDS